MMKRLIMSVAMLSVGAAAVVQMIEPEVETAAPVLASAAEAAPVRSRREVEVRADPRGHFAVRTYVNGQPMEMLADTGATAIALRESDARRIGLRFDPADFTATVRTANGEARAARVRLATVEVEAIRMHNVDALVLPDKLLGENLLGMSFIGRLDRFEVGSGRLVLAE